MSIDIHYKGRLGNNLFQYGIALIIAEETGIGLAPYQGRNRDLFKNCMSHIPENRVRDMSYFIPVVNIRQDFDFNEIVSISSHIDKIHLDGFFQVADYYECYRNRLKHWYHIPETDWTPDEEDIVFHIRRSDFAPNDSILPFSWYEKVLEVDNYKKVYLCGHPVDLDDEVRGFFKKYNAECIGTENELSAIQKIKRFTKVVQSTSSFCWWAVYLSDKAIKIYTPIPSKGFWSPSRTEQRLIINRPEYINFKQEEGKWQLQSKVATPGV
jgi:hypothetical protein